MKKNFLFIAMLLITILNSCKKDNLPIDEGINYKSNILGSVTDESNLPVEGATATFNGLTKTTDKNGIYIFTNVDVSSKNNLIKIRKAAYFETSRTFNTRKSADIQLRNILSKKDFNKNFIASSGGIIAANGYVITFPADAIVIESSSASYSGQVKVAVKYLDPSLDATYSQMPGNLSAINASNAISKLTTYGMLYVELQSTSGEKLQIKTGKQAEIAVSVPSALLSSAPSTIPLWYFDESDGYWKEEGTAALSNGIYSGKVSHFSCWNYDATIPSINVSGRVVDQYGNPLVCDIRFYVPGQYGGHGYTNSDGTFSGPIGKDVQLSLEIYALTSGCSNSLIYNAQVGPFSTDVILPDIIVTLTGAQTFNCFGTFNDCNGNPVQNGYMKVSDGTFIYNTHYYPIINGQSSGSYVTCSSSLSTTVTGIDIDNLKESSPINLIGIGPHNLGIVSVCGITPDYLSVNCPGLGIINEVIFELTAVDSNDIKTIYSNENSSNIVKKLFFIYKDASISSYATGTFNIVNADFLYVPTSNYYDLVNGTVTITQGGTSGNTLIGTYNMVMKNAVTMTQESFSGSFQTKL